MAKTLLRSSGDNEQCLFRAFLPWERCGLLLIIICFRCSFICLFSLMTMLTYEVSPVPAPLIELTLLPATDESPSLIEFIAFTTNPFGRLTTAGRGVIDAATPWCWARLLSAKAAGGGPSQCTSILWLEF